MGPEGKESLDKARRYCARAEKCLADVRQKLQEWNVATDDISPILKNLVDNGFVDEDRYARAFVSDKVRLSKWGRIKIVLGLRRKQVAEPSIRRALADLEDADYVAMIQSELKKKKRSLPNTDPLALRGQLYRFGMARGYETALIQNVLDQMGLDEL